MSSNRVANRYAKAFFELSKEKGSLDETLADMKGISNACDDAALLNVLRNPVVENSKKTQIVDELFGSRVSGLTKSLLKLLSSKERLVVLKEVASEYVELNKKHQGIVDATLTTARPVDDSTVDGIADALGKKYNKTFLIKKEEDANLIGGFKLHVEGRIHDSSIKTQLERLREDLVAGLSS